MTNLRLVPKKKSDSVEASTDQINLHIEESDQNTEINEKPGKDEAINDSDIKPSLVQESCAPHINLSTVSPSSRSSGNPVYHLQQFSAYAPRWSMSAYHGAQRLKTPPIPMLMPRAVHPAAWKPALSQPRPGAPAGKPALAQPRPDAPSGPQFMQARPFI